MPKLPANQASTSTLPSKSGDVYISKTLGELLDGMEAVVKRADNYLPTENFRSDDLIDSKSTRKVQLVITECPMLLKLGMPDSNHLLFFAYPKRGSISYH